MGLYVISQVFNFYFLETGCKSNKDAELRIHEHTERGDNDTVKMPNGQKVTIDGKKCSDK